MRLEPFADEHLNQIAAAVVLPSNVGDTVAEMLQFDMIAVATVAINVSYI
jgi:hypothetical protein